MLLQRRFIFQQHTEPKHKTRASQERLRNNIVNVLEWQSQSPSQSNREFVAEIAAKLIETYPHRLKAAIAAKGASTKYWLGGGEYL